MAQQGKNLPKYVRAEFEEYLKCGCLEHGFLRVKYESCQHERMVALVASEEAFALVLVLGV
jgi:hypothetical protein